MISISQMTPEQIPAVRELMVEYLAWAFTLHVGSFDAPTFHGIDEELRDLPGVFGPPLGRFLVATLDGAVCGCVALKPHDDKVCELKRLYVDPEARGHNLGYLLVSRLIEEARAIGYEKIVLDSHKSMTAAHAIYRKAGFVDVGPAAGFPTDLRPFVVFMEMQLSG